MIRIASALAIALSLAACGGPHPAPADPVLIASDDPPVAVAAPVIESAWAQPGTNLCVVFCPAGKVLFGIGGCVTDGDFIPGHYQVDGSKMALEMEGDRQLMSVVLSAPDHLELTDAKGGVDAFDRSALSMAVCNVDWASSGGGAYRDSADRDGDYIADDVDQCPDDLEDFDDFEDMDGCPDPDNDLDGILDHDDYCPNEPENKDGFEDSDGCPEHGANDRDGDGLGDNSDACPDDPEDTDGFEDGDGCPDVDNDRDGILDVDDLCPSDPEDHDGFEDEDGCPDPDNDRDRILDINDKCPNEPENYNGRQDADGCPD